MVIHICIHTFSQYSLGVGITIKNIFIFVQLSDAIQHESAENAHTTIVYKNVVNENDDLSSFALTLTAWGASAMILQSGCKVLNEKWYNDRCRN